ncbi:MAG: hypothetical protein PUC32_06005 [Oscillospiraceae bacterium]|nr:hypothetical protein [Oscillospiraceae bacterium]
MKKGFALLVGVMMLAMVLLTGCGNSITGTTWEAETIEMGGQTYDVKKLADAMKAESGITYSFQEDNQVKIQFFGENEEESYDYQDGKVTIDGQTYEIQNDTIELDRDGQKIILKKQ